MKIHWKILAWLLAGALVGWGFHFLDASPASPVSVEESGGSVVVAKVGGNIDSIKPGDVLDAVILNRGDDAEVRLPITSVDAYRDAIARTTNGDIVWHAVSRFRLDPTATEREGRAVVSKRSGLYPVTMTMAADSQRAVWIRPFAFVADMFLRLLKMLIVPVILTSIVTGVVGVGAGRNLRRLGLKTFGYYITTSMLAIMAALVIVNVVRPGDGARLGLEYDPGFQQLSQTSFVDVLLRMIPENIFEGFSSNLNMLQVIFFALLFGYFILRVDDRHRTTMQSFFESAFEVMMKLASFVLALIPYGVFCLLVKVVGQTGFSVFKPLGVYMLTVTGALLVHFFITLPFILRVIGRINPWRWMKAMTPALLTAFSTSSSSMTLPVSMETVEEHGKVSNKVTSFVQPLGATINMDGTALYECTGVIFLAQYYASVSGGAYELTIGMQVTTVFMALLASIGAAGIPSAGLIMMLTILSVLNLPVEGAALLLAVDRPLDMLRTVVNVFSDTCGSAVIARSEGEDVTGSLT